MRRNCVAFTDCEAAERAGALCAKCCLHFHSLDDEHSVADADYLPFAGENARDDPSHRRADVTRVAIVSRWAGGLLRNGAAVLYS